MRGRWRTKAYPNDGPMTKLFAHPMWDHVPVGGLRRSMVHHGPRRRIALAIADVWDRGDREFQTREIAEASGCNIKITGTVIVKELKHYINLKKVRIRRSYSELPKTGWRFVHDNQK